MQAESQSASASLPPARTPNLTPGEQVRASQMPRHVCEDVQRACEVRVISAACT